MSTSPPAGPPSLQSVSTLHLNHTTSPRPQQKVVTAPPWAKDEPPSPTHEHSSNHDVSLAPPNEPRPSDAGSFQSSNHPSSPSRWWTFTLPTRPRELHDDPGYNVLPQQLHPHHKPERKSLTFKDRSMSWRPKESTSFSKRGEKSEDDTAPGRLRRDWNLSITLPAPPSQPFTVTHNATPGWETPWTSRVDAQGPNRVSDEERQSLYEIEEDGESTHSSQKDMTTWRKRKKRLRMFILANPYVPLLFRIINITFTSAALGVAIRIRLSERANGAMGAVGSSPTLVIIFAPLTLTHVMAAIYLEYFGRPLGLWRTSGKLFHTLSEVVFICAWSAALALCFDNFFTSLVPCASWSHISWYNELPQPPSNIPNFEGSVGDLICDNQLALICLVAVGLIMYCINLVISLFRIFEKVKYHPAGRP